MRGIQRKFRLRGLVMLAVLAAACVSLVATASVSASPAEKTHRIAFFTDGLVNTYLQAAVDEGKKVAKANGVALDVFSADFDPNKQLAQLQDAISSKKYDGIVFEAIDGSVVCKSLQQAVKQGIKVSVYNTPICGNFKTLYTPGTIGYFGRSEILAGQQLVDAMAQGLGGKGKIAYVNGPTQVSIVRVIDESVTQRLKKYPNIKIVATVSGQWDPAKGLAATQDILQSHPDVDGILYATDNMAAASLKALKAAGKLGKLTIVGLGGTTPALAAIKAGTWYATVAILPREEAGRATLAMIQTLKGQKLNIPGLDAKTKIYNTLKDPMYGGKPPIVTKANAGSFKAEWSY